METKSIYTVDYFITKLSAIPEDRWCVGTLQDSTGRRCALGHFHPAFNRPDPLYCGDDLGDFIMLFHDNLKTAAYMVNNGDCPHYQQTTPKQRILAALYDIKAKQQPKEKVVYKTVVIDSAVKELQSILTEN